jgi:hypothetical protein
LCDEKKYGTVSIGGSFNILRGGHFSCKGQGTEVNVEKPPQILNETRTAIEANNDPGALSQLDLADEVLSGDSKISASSNMINTTAIVTC